MLSGDHGYILAFGSVTSHKPTQLSNFQLPSEMSHLPVATHISYYGRSTNAPWSIVEIRRQFTSTRIFFQQKFRFQTARNAQKQNAPCNRMNQLRFTTSTTHFVQRQNGKWYLLGVHDPTIALFSSDKHTPAPSLNCRSITKDPTLFSVSNTVQQLTGHTYS